MNGTGGDDAGRLSDLALPDPTRVVCLYRENAFRAPADDERLEPGDELVLIADGDGLPQPRASLTVRSSKLGGVGLVKVGLFVPCYVDAFFPEVAIATLELLERFGCEVDYPTGQTCCGQPMANSGCEADAAGAEALFVDNFARFDHVVGPSGSCVHHIREHLTAIEQTPEVRRVRANTFELVEYLHDVLGARAFPWAEFPFTASLHVGCSTLRGLHEASTSEFPSAAPFSKPRTLLSAVRGLRLVQPARPDECCGFGGTFSIFEEPVSARMGQDKVRDHVGAGAEVIVSTDMSCTMHQKGCAERMGLALTFMHIAQVLNGARP